MLEVQLHADGKPLMRIGSVCAVWGNWAVAVGGYKSTFSRNGGKSKTKQRKGTLESKLYKIHYTFLINVVEVRCSLRVHGVE